MYRLFVGITLPEAIADALLALQGGVYAARWQARAQLHMTLRFIGEVNRRTANDLADALARLSHPAFTAQTEGAGCFENRGVPHTLFVHVRPYDALHRLHKKIDHSLTALGLPAEARQFVPHITLARLNAESGPLAHFLETHGGFAGAPFPVTDFCLFESTLTRDGAHYTVVARYPLS